MTTQVLSSRPEYDYVVVATTPTRVLLNHGIEVELTSWASSPEYGPMRVMGVGFKVKKDGTRGNQPVKPILGLSACPEVVRVELARLGYGPTTGDQRG